MTPNVMHFFQNSLKNDQHIPVQNSNSVYPPSTSKLGVPLQSSLPSLGNLWNDPSAPLDSSVSQPKHSLWATAAFTRPQMNAARDANGIYVDEDLVFSKIQNEIHRNETDSNPRWAGSANRLSRMGPPGFNNFGFNMEDRSVDNNTNAWGGRFGFKQ
jgi:hypothetical protein